MMLNAGGGTKKKRKRFGELPPLNFNMSRKRDDSTSEEDLKWARQGLEYG